MKKIYVNNTKRTFVFGEALLLPGSNVVNAIDEKKFPMLSQLVEDGFLEITEDAVSAIKKANTQATVDEIAKTAPKDEKVKVAAGKRKATLDEMDEEAKKLVEKKAKQQEEEDEKGAEK